MDPDIKGLYDNNPNANDVNQSKHNHIDDTNQHIKTNSDNENYDYPKPSNDDTKI